MPAAPLPTIVIERAIGGYAGYQLKPSDVLRFNFAYGLVHELKALERPGLWNGAMAFWNTLFVEVPIETFAPVKGVLDLLRPEHRPG